MTQVTTYDRRSADPLASLFNGILGRTAPWGFEAFGSEGDWMPAADVSSDRDGYRFHFDLPGVAKEDINVSLEDNVLTVTSERKNETEDAEGKSVHRRERFFGSFTRSFKLPNDADADQVDAKYADGVLTLTVGKQEASKPRKISVA